MVSLRTEGLGLALASLALAWAAGRASGAEAAGEEPQAMRFRDFSGVCQGGVLPPALAGAIGWNRHDLDWNRVEPKPGEYDEGHFQRWCDRVLANRGAGVTLLPMLGYNAAWAGRETYSYEPAPGQRFDMQRLPGGKYRCAFFRRGAGGEWVAGSVQERDFIRPPIADEHIPKWEAFVEKAVAKLMAPPYGLRYFQVWNEAWPDSGFFHGSLDDYMKTVHLPAARVVQRLGGKVVYGGWVCAGPVSEFVALLDRHDAWDTVDVLDLHYFPLASMDYLVRAMRARGLAKPVWQTEFGFSSDPGFVANSYPRVLYWALRRGLPGPDGTKLFYFAQGAPDDPKAYGYRRSLMAGDKPTPNAVALKVLADLFGDAPPAAYEPVVSSPKLGFEVDERLSSLEAFRAGDRLVVAVHLLENNSAKIFVDWNGDGDTLHLNHADPVLTLAFPGVAPERIAKVERAGQFGQRSELTAVSGEDGATVRVPIRDRRDRDAAYTDMPEDVLPKAFYVVLTLKGQ